MCQSEIKCHTLMSFNPEPMSWRLGKGFTVKPILFWKHNVSGVGVSQWDPLYLHSNLKKVGLSFWFLIISLCNYFSIRGRIRNVERPVQKNTPKPRIGLHFFPFYRLNSFETVGQNRKIALSLIWSPILYYMGHIILKSLKFFWISWRGSELYHLITFKSKLFQWEYIFLLSAFFQVLTCGSLAEKRIPSHIMKIWEKFKKFKNRRKMKIIINICAAILLVLFIIGIIYLNYSVYHVF